MAIGSDNEFPKIIGVEQGSNPAAPVAGRRKFFPKADGWYDENSAGVVTGPFGTGGASSPFVGARGNRSTVQLVTTGAWTAVQFNAEDFDTSAFHDNVTNNSRFTIPAAKAGFYRVTALPLWQANATGVRYRAIAKNGIRITAANAPAANNATNGFGFVIDDVLSCAVADYLEVHVYQDSGAGLDLSIGSYMVVEYLGA